MSELNEALFAAPLLIAIFTMTFLSKTSLNIRITAGISLALYYILMSLIFLIIGGGEFPFIIIMLWFPWLFFLGFVSSMIVEKIQRKPLIY